MALFNPLLLFIALAHFASLTLTQPLDSITAPSLAARADVCYNAPASKAGTIFKRSNPDLTPLSPRATTDFPGNSRLTWCTPQCQTYIRVTYIAEIPAGKSDWPTIRTFLTNAHSVCQTQLTNGDKVIPHGGWMYGVNWQNTYGLELLFRNSNNHQLTWGVNAAALVVLVDYFGAVEKAGTLPGTVHFSIVDGENEVAVGVFGLQGEWTEGRIAGRDGREVGSLRA